MKPISESITDFAPWIDVMLTEHGVDLEDILVVGSEDDEGEPVIIGGAPVGAVVDFLKTSEPGTQQAFRNKISEMRAGNALNRGSLIHFLGYCAAKLIQLVLSDRAAQKHKGNETRH